uniref:4-methyl-5(B-hydroxyethyl)-thiazole monophosphate biosynthesis protein n=1 Tax=uncultured Helicobacter sp. TaxID=175537 RepID=A0A650EKX3_9HELI|nr:4-methyl-5(B-hydroxyethyl)-thiazole monophosphate biosynthesis protein [uncultured Helicobacter sp.]
MKNILVPIAQGFEEIELVSIIDTLRRAGLNVIVASLDSQKLVRGGHQIFIQADMVLSEVDISSLGAIVLAGGLEGMQNLAASSKIIEIIQTLDSQKSLVCAICASPIVLNKAGVLKGDFTCYPGCEENIKAHRLEAAVVKNENIITSAGPATGILFALEIIKELCGAQKAQALWEGMQIPLAQSYPNTFAS